MSQDNPSAYTFTRVDANNVADAARLFEAVHGKQASPEGFVRKYSLDMRGGGFLGCIAHDAQGVCVGHYALSPCKILWRGDALPAGQGGDVMIHPGHRGLFILRRLGKFVHALAADHGIKLAFGFPNQAAFLPEVRLWKGDCSAALRRYRLPVRALPLERACRRFAPLKQGYRRFSRGVIGRFAGRCGQFARRHDPAGQAVVLHDEEFFARRSHPQHLFVERGEARAWLSTSRGIALNDIDAPSPAEAGALFEALRRAAVAAGASEIHTIASEGSALDRLFSLICLAEPGPMMNCKDFGSGIQLEALSFCRGDIDTFY